MKKQFIIMWTGIVLVLGLTNGTSTAGTKFETFDTAESAASHGWVEINSRANGNNFGFSNTNNAGGIAGEAGGIFKRHTVKSFYVDTNMGGTLNQSNTFSASGKVNFKSPGTASIASYIAYANTGSTGSSDAIGLEWSQNSNGTTFDIWAFFDNGTHNEIQFINRLAPGEYLFEIGYNGMNSLTVTLKNTDGSAKGTTTIATSGNMSFNCFGMVGRNSSSVGTQYDEVYMDDVAYESAEALLSKVQFDGAPSSANLESVTPVVLNVKVVNPVPGETYTVDYMVTGGTAAGCGEDYFSWFAPCDTNDLLTFSENWLSSVEGFNPSNLYADSQVDFKDYSFLAGNWLTNGGTLVFEPGQTSKVIELDIMDDGLDEGDETIAIELTNPTGGVSLGINSKHTYTIAEWSSYDVNELDGYWNIKKIACPSAASFSFMNFRDGKLVWKAKEYNVYHIFQYDGIDISQISIDPVGSYDYPVTSCGNVAWRANGPIIFYDNNLKSSICLFNANPGSSPWVTIFGRKVTWNQSGCIWLYNGTTVSKLTDLEWVGMYPMIGEVGLVCEGVEWQQKSEIYFYDGQFHRITNNNFGDSSPKISGHYLTWLYWPTANSYLLRFYDLETGALQNLTSELPNGDTQQSSSSMLGNKVTWTEYNSSKGIHEVKYFNGTFTTIIAESVYGGASTISERGIAWTDYDGDDLDIFFFDWSVTHQITDNDFDDYYPIMDQHGIAWYGTGSLNSNSWDIYIASFP